MPKSKGQIVSANGIEYRVSDIRGVVTDLGGDYAKLPYSLRILAENVLRGEADPEAALKVICARSKEFDIPFRPARVVLQDLLGTPALVDLAGLRDAVAAQGGNPRLVNPVTPTHLVVDHSLNVERWGDASALADNEAIERERNAERFQFLDWCNKAFSNLSIIPSGKGILHQINLERLTTVIGTQRRDGELWAFPDTLVGTDSHTTMINAIGVLGWGVGGIEAEAAMLGKSLMLRLPEIVGVRLEGTLPQGYLATDIALALTELLRKAGVIGSFLEFFGPGVPQLSLADRGTLSNMAPEFGATAAMFAIDDRTLHYLRITGRGGQISGLTEAYARAQGLWHDSLGAVEYNRVVTLDLGTVERSIAGPKQPHQRIVLGQKAPATNLPTGLDNGSVVLAAITSCTNTSNPRGVIAAGLVARNARKRGLKRAPWVKTSFAPGSMVVAGYLERSGLNNDLDALGFNLVGYGCTTCNGMSGPLLSPEIEEEIRTRKLETVAATSGNRNFEGRVHPLAREVFIMSPPLIVAYAIAGTYLIDPEKDALGVDDNGVPVYLHELWPSDEELTSIETENLTADLFDKAYEDVPREAGLIASDLRAGVSDQYAWQANSTYIRKPPYWSDAVTATDISKDLSNMRVLAMLSDNITTDHISPSGAILPESDAGQYLQSHGIAVPDFNSYGTRRGNHEAAQRATFASPRLKNELLEDGREGPWTLLLPEKEVTTIFQAAEIYADRKQSLIVVAGKEYGSGSSRDWAAKGPRLLGVRVVVAESFERIHRTNLAGLGILPLQFEQGVSRQSLGLNGRETFSVEGITDDFQPGAKVTLVIERENGETERVTVVSRLDTFEDVRYFRNGGLLPQLLIESMKNASAN
ncbi:MULTISPECIES: aconitate hydratase [Pseudomonas]|jgi:aconitate hydratase|uniref:aconitate hydratase n=2 Tax=Pseudomonas TaxID=286 RepID=A0A2T4FR03_9PSED|nr:MULTISPECIES: aconitate hydratase [Pseudomonas]OCW30434.1 Fe/S-dependent 2-methylisocitrate dehydratase AcnD [Pseudomonas aylmerensis]POA24727.1 aconitate hydratase [Pseudomonas sp. FW305-3-2-15-E-TSA4]POA41952.1 aconitate hydratase [Pseudomonas sp. FW305-3-2-15-E-TSA2]PTC25851.1 aconitate hydratase [Pseudomonas aylmerensis]TNB92719.1 aconitate hydratase [Pseudomonas jessenii]